MRHITTRHIPDITDFKQKLLHWSQQFDTVVWMDSNQYNTSYSSFEAILAVDGFTSIQTDYFEAFDALKTYQESTKDWIFGYLTYDVKNGMEHLKSNNFDGLEFPDVFFFQPKKLFLIKGNQLEIQYLNRVDDEVESDFESICKFQNKETISESNPIKIKHRITKDAYFEKVNNMLAHIHRGDIYEANFCQEFYAEAAEINPLDTYLKLNNVSKPPFATFFKLYDTFLMSASPERYIKKVGNSIISQPIKGTAKRSKDVLKDEQLKQDLEHNEKERAENIMIVDLVRNDLSKTAIKGSVTVKELCKVYTFPQVHQMISTVTSKISENTKPVAVLQTTFPMGSMTGAPKLSAMKIIEDLEETKRGLYSGTVGYFTPGGDFDFNVVIRSILYNQSKKYVSYSVGGAITSKSNPESEYEECLVKAKAMRDVLER